MNCLEFRRINLADPQNRSESFLDHRRECPDCARFADEVETLDHKMLDVMRVPVPEDLETRIKLRQVIGDEKEDKRQSVWHYALAASVLFTVSLSAFFGWQVYTTARYVEQLEASVVGHVKLEPQFLVGNPNPFAKQEFKRVLAAFGGRLVQDMMPVNHAEICALQNKSEPVLHSVIEGQRGPVTVLYVRGKPLPDRTPFQDSDMKGIFVPAGRGNLAIMGNMDETLEPIVEHLGKSIIWEI